MLALLHPMMPFVTEEIWSLPPGPPAATSPSTRSRSPTSRCSTTTPRPRSSAAIELTRRAARLARPGRGPGRRRRCAARIDGVEPPEFVGRLARFEFDGDGGEPVASVGPVEVLASDELDAEAVADRLEERREELRAEVERGEGKLGNEGFVAKAPAEVVEEERGKLERYRAELEELA